MMKVHDLVNNYRLTPALTEHFKIQFCSIIVFLFIYSNVFEESETGLMSVYLDVPLIVPLKESLWLVIDHSPSDFMWEDFWLCSDNHETSECFHDDDIDTSTVLVCPLFTLSIPLSSHAHPSLIITVHPVNEKLQEDTRRVWRANPRKNKHDQQRPLPTAIGITALVFNVPIRTLLSGFDHLQKDY